MRCLSRGYSMKWTRWLTIVVLINSAYVILSQTDGEWLVGEKNMHQACQEIMRFPEKESAGLPYLYEGSLYVSSHERGVGYR